MVLVTDKQYYMDGYLQQNLDEVPRFLKRGWDCVIIVSGHSKVRIGKSTHASQIGYYIAWLLAGGEKKPKEKEVFFSNESFAFSPDELMQKAEKFPRNSVIIYDEAMTGLNSSRAMENINKIMLDFFTECGHLGHVILIALPNYFRLSEDIAVPRSLFLIDDYTGKEYQRGYFAFYNEVRKELLYSFGKKRYGTYQKYNATNPNFRGRFGKEMPGIDREKYENDKKRARRTRKLTFHQKKILKQRNICFYIMNKELKMTEQDISDKVSLISKEKITQEAVSKAILGLIRNL